MRKLIFIIYSILLLITPFINSDELYNGLISTRQIWFWGVASLIFITYSVYFIFKKKNTFHINLTDICIAAWGVYLLFIADITPYSPVIYNIKFVNYLIIIGIYFIFRHFLSSNNRLFYENVLICLLLFASLVQSIWGLLQLYGYLPSLNANFKITGTFYNPAPYALYLSVILPLAVILSFGNSVSLPLFLSYFRYKWINSIIKFISEHYGIIFTGLPVLTLIAILLVLPVSLIRASWLAGLSGVMYVLVVQYSVIQKIKSIFSVRFYKFFFILIFTALVILTGYALYNIKKDSSNGKLLITEVTLRKIMHKPVFGYGLGRFEAEYNNWQAEYFKNNPDEAEGIKGKVAGNTKYAFNDFLELTSETGFIGLLLFLMVVISPVLKKRSDTTPNRENKYLKGFNGMYLSLLVALLFSFPLFSLPTLIILPVLLSLLSTNKNIILFKWESNHWFIKIGVVLICLFLIALGVFLSDKSKKTYNAYYTFDEAVLLYQGDNYKEASNSFLEIYPTLKYNGEYLQYYGKNLYLNKKYPESLKMLSEAKKFTSDEILFTTLGDCYKVAGNTLQAEKAYQFAHYMVPHKFYPLYLKVILFNETGDTINAKKLAAKLLKKTIKIPSQAIDEMKSNLDSILNNK
jgi:O-antigen polymerase